MFQLSISSASDLLELVSSQCGYSINAGSTSDVRAAADNACVAERDGSADGVRVQLRHRASSAVDIHQSRALAAQSARKTSTISANDQRPTSSMLLTASWPQKQHRRVSAELYSRKKSSIAEYDHPLRQQNPILLKKLGASSLGNLNPDLYKDPEEGDLSHYPDNHIGRLWFTIAYDRQTEKLHVQINKARNLNIDHNKDTTVDSFVRVSLEGDDCQRQPFETKVRRKNNNPTYGDSVGFEAPKTNFDHQSVKFVVIAIDGKRYLPVGMVCFPLKDYTLCKQTSLTVWRDLKIMSTQEGTRGDVRVSLYYDSDSEKLTVTIVEAADLLSDEKELIDTFCKIAFECADKQLKSKRTKVFKKSLHPVYNETFDCKIGADKLALAGITLQIWCSKPNKQLGQVKIGGDRSGAGQRHWQKMIELPKTTITERHTIMQ